MRRGATPGRATQQAYAAAWALQQPVQPVQPVHAMYGTVPTTLADARPLFRDEEYRATPGL
ncbi:hypothetical protein [Streptomyces sp. NPDC005486]|uniref:hypothetical protein n=1 Tax=Streptomyces sp. NPDC005486 TaxID=3155345 RepID=UPI0033B0EFF7